MEDKDKSVTEKRPKTKVSFRRVNVNQQEAKARVSHAFGLLFEEVLKSMETDKGGTDLL